MTTQATFNEMLDSLTGYEELAIQSGFDADINTLINTHATFAVRACIAVDLARQGSTAAEAKKAAMSLTLTEVNAYFREDVEEPFPEEPVTESGKDAAHDS